MIHRFSQNTNEKLSRFLPSLYTGQKSWQFFVCILGETMTSWILSEIVWPLEGKNIRIRKDFEHIVMCSSLFKWSPWRGSDHLSRSRFLLALMLVCLVKTESATHVTVEQIEKLLASHLQNLYLFIWNHKEFYLHTSMWSRQTLKLTLESIICHFGELTWL